MKSKSRHHIVFITIQRKQIVIEIKLNANELTLQQVFDAVFKGNDIHYAISNGNNVFVSKRYSIQTTLPKNFFDPEEMKLTAAHKLLFLLKMPSHPNPI